jgi:hypothetical protein
MSGSKRVEVDDLAGKAGHILEGTFPQKAAQRVLIGIGVVATVIILLLFFYLFKNTPDFGIEVANSDAMQIIADERKAVVENFKGMAGLLLPQFLGPIAALAAGFLFGKST